MPLRPHGLTFASIALARRYRGRLVASNLKAYSPLQSIG